MNREQMLLRVQTADFALYEARLFLDTHPQDKAALEYYRRHLTQAETAKKEFEAKYGPLMPQDIQGDSWDWINDPWPWENQGRYE